MLVRKKHRRCLFCGPTSPVEELRNRHVHLRRRSDQADKPRVTVREDGLPLGPSVPGSARTPLSPANPPSPLRTRPHAEPNPDSCGRKSPLEPKQDVSTAACPLSTADGPHSCPFQRAFCARSAQSRAQAARSSSAGTAPSSGRAGPGLTHDSKGRRLSGRARSRDEPCVIHSRIPSGKPRLRWLKPGKTKDPRQSCPLIPALERPPLLSPACGLARGARRGRRRPGWWPRESLVRIRPGA